MPEHRFFIALALCCYILPVITSRVESKSDVRLSSGHTIPIVGFGTHGFDKELLENILTTALDNGLRHIDTGFVYKNEETIGRVLKKWFEKGGKRKDVFVTSKLPYFDNRAESVEKYLKLSLEKLGLQYVDLYLIHTPFGVLHKNGSDEIATNEDGTVALDYEVDHIAIWKEMEKQVEAGRVKSIGLSNFNETQVSKILKAAKIKPSNLQIEVHLYHQQKALRAYCESHEIAVTAYAPLGSAGARPALRPDKNPADFPEPSELALVQEIAARRNRSPVDVLLRHTLQSGTVVIPSSKKLHHLKANLRVVNFELSEEEMGKLDALDKGDDGKIFNYRFYRGIEKHPEYPFGDA